VESEQINVVASVGYYGQLARFKNLEEAECQLCAAYAA
jgi:hypothetical protein